jgi:hypothetical protein
MSSRLPTTQNAAARIIGAAPAKLAYEVQCNRLRVIRIGPRSNLVTLEAIKEWLSKYGWKYNYKLPKDEPNGELTDVNRE